MFRAFVDHTAIGALAFEHAARIMQAVGQQADLGIMGRDELAVEPEGIRSLVEWHRHGISLLMPRFCAALMSLRRFSAFASEHKSRYGRGSLKRATYDP